MLHKGNSILIKFLPVWLKAFSPRVSAMEGSFPSFWLLLVAAVVAAASYALNHFYVPRLSAREPPLFPHPVPYIGHIIGLLRYGTRYYEMTRSVALLLSSAENLLN